MLLVISHPWVLNVLFPGCHPDSSMRHGSFREHQSPRPSSSSVQSNPVVRCPWRYKEDDRLTWCPEALPEAQFWFVARIAASYPTPRYFYWGLPLCQWRSSTWRSKVTVTLDLARDSKSWHGRQSRFFFSAHVATCPAPAPDGRR